MKTKKKRTFWKDFKFKYKISIINENTLEEVTKLRLSKWNGLSVILFTSFVIFFISSALIALTPLHYYLPGYVNSELRSQIVDNSITTDSIAEAIRKQNRYISNLQMILNDELSIDSLYITNDSITTTKDSITPKTDREIEFRKNYEEAERYNLTNISTSQNELVGLKIFTPVRGVVINKFDPQKGHYGIDVTTMPNTNIHSILDGTVIIDNYTPEFGYTIAIQHPSNIVSIYKHCSKLLKKTGDKVKNGEAIGLTRNDETHNIKHLHFEFWHKGKAINPDKYIVF